MVDKYALFPVKDKESFVFRQKQENILWFAEELKFTDDKLDYDRCNPNMKRVIDLIMAFFSVGDGAISENLLERFLLESETYEERSMFITQLYVEQQHAITYGMSTQTFIPNTVELEKLLQEVDNSECVKKKVEFMQKWCRSDKPRHLRLIAFACAEGIFFCTLFAAVFWFRSRGIFNNFISANEMISRDETLHRDYGIMLFSRAAAKLGVSLNDPETLEVIEEALEIEDLFIDQLLSEPLEDLNAADMKTYARVITNNMLTTMGYNQKYQVKNPFTWLNDINLEQKGNFYEVTVASYKKRSMTETLDWESKLGWKEASSVLEDPSNVDF